MILEKSMHEGWLSNTWLVADEPGGRAVLIDSGGPAHPIVDSLRRHELTLSYVLCTHHHHDHVANNALFREEFGAKVVAHPEEVELFRGIVDETLDDEATVEAGGLKIRALFIPGHTRGQLAFVVNEERVFTGDTLFKGSIGGTRGPGHTTFADIRHSIMERLMTLPPEMPVHPGHTVETTIGQEWEHNPFIRIWRGLDAPEEKPCVALGEKATLVLRAGDYDGGTKCWVRFGDTDDIVPGSRVED